MQVVHASRARSWPDPLRNSVLNTAHTKHQSVVLHSSSQQGAPTDFVIECDTTDISGGECLLDTAGNHRISRFLLNHFSGQFSTRFPMMKMLAIAGEP